MKTVIGSLVFIICGFTVRAQVVKETAVPAAVKNKFSSMYPQAGERKWEKEPGKFEVSFKNGTEETEVLFSVDGTFLQTEVDIPVVSIPAAIVDYIATQSEGKITEAEKITSSSGTITYQVELDGYDYFFDEQGKFLRKEKDDDAGEKND